MINIFRKKYYICSRCGYKTKQKLERCPTCKVKMEEICCKCNHSKGNCSCKVC